MVRRTVLTLAAVFGGLALYLSVWPIPLEPVAFTPPKPPPLTGKYEANNRLASVEGVGPAVPGPEDVAFDAEGRVYTGVSDGRIMRFGPDGSGPVVLANTGGRPLGMAVNKAGSLIVADARRGLLSIESDRSIRALARVAQQRPIILANAVDVAADGRVYFTDSSIYPLGQFRSDWMDGRPHGRLLLYDPQNGATQVLLDGLYLANGVTLGPAESFVLISESLAYRVTRYWLNGPRRGEREVFIDNLPGFPDNISFDGQGIFWLALVWPRAPRLETLQASPFLRRVLMRLPARFVPMPELRAHGFVLGLDLNGNVVFNLQDPSGNYASYISSARAHHGMIYFGTIGQGSTKRIPVPRTPDRSSR